MSSPDLSELTGRDRLAAEHALRLLEGEALVEARGLVASDPAFAADVAAWENHFAPLMDEIAPMEPGPDLWAQIERRLQERDPASLSTIASNDNITALQGQVRRWRWISGGAVAAAVVLLAVMVGPLVGPTVQPSPNVKPGTMIAANDAPLVASIPIADTPLRIGVTYLPDRGEMLVSASGLEADGVHDHELWLVPPQGAPQSLGVVVPGEERRVRLDAALAEQLADGSDLILTREPLGGAPAGGTAGPTVASGTFSAV